MAHAPSMSTGVGTAGSAGRLGQASAAVTMTRPSADTPCTSVVSIAQALSAAHQWTPESPVSTGAKFPPPPPQPAHAEAPAPNPTRHPSSVIAFMCPPQSKLEARARRLCLATLAEDSLSRECHKVGPPLPKCVTPQGTHAAL